MNNKCAELNVGLSGSHNTGTHNEQIFKKMNIINEKKIFLGDVLFTLNLQCAEFAYRKQALIIDVRP